MRKAQRQNAGRAAVAAGATIPAPTGGWDAISPLPEMPPDRAVALVNWFPQPGYVEVRRGYALWAGLGTGAAVESLMAYNAVQAANDRLFAVAGNTFWDVSVQYNPVPCTLPGPITSNRWQSVNFQTAGGTPYLWCCNGQDAPLAWNGAAWSNPALTVQWASGSAGPSASTIAAVTAHKKRLWFVHANSMLASYLPVQSYQGTATVFDLSSVFTKGGSLATLGTWSIDTTAALDDYLAFISSKGQVAVYQGTDPNSASTWALVGVYDLGTPIGGARCLAKIGPDIACISIDGVTSLAKGQSQDRAVSDRVAFTHNIRNAMNAAARAYGSNFGWGLTVYPKGTMLLLNVPVVENSIQEQYVMNTLTGAWARFTGQNANCWAVFEDNLYFGDNAGAVMQADAAGTDYRSSFTAQMKCAFNYFDLPGQKKRWLMVQPQIVTNQTLAPLISVDSDFEDNQPVAGAGTLAIQGASWDAVQWDRFQWAAATQVYAQWTSVSGMGQAGALRLNVPGVTGPVPALFDQAQFDVSLYDVIYPQPITIQVSGFALTFERGGLIT